MSWIWTVLSAIVLLYLLQKRKRLPPGPRGLPILGHLHLLGKNPNQSLSNLARKYGPIMALRFGFVRAVVVSSPAAAELVFKTHDLAFCSKPRREAAVHMFYDQSGLVFAPYGPYWRHMRKLSTSNLLNNSNISQFQKMRRIEVGLLVASLKARREIVDLSTRVSLLVGDMNCLMLFGRKYSGSEREEVIIETVGLVGKSNLADYFPYVGLLDLQGLNHRMKRLSKTIDGVLQRIIDDHVEKKQQKNQGADIVDTLMTIMESGEAGFEFDSRHVKAVLLDLLIAGTDTSAATIGWTMSEIMRHPSVMKKVQQELESVVGLEQMVEESHLDKLNYLDCVVKESLRLHPVVPILTHQSMEDCVLDGFHIPKKSRIMVNAWAIGRDPNVWPNPDLFMPERFIGSDVDVRGQHFVLIPFGSGRRGCPGQQLALRVVKEVVAQLVHCFDWELPNGIKPSDLDMSEQFGIVTARAKHLMAIPNYRLHTCI